LDPKSQIGIYLGPEIDGPGRKILVYDPNLRRENRYAVHIVRDIVTCETLNVVTGAQSEADLHWGGSILLPVPLEIPPQPKPLEALKGATPLPAQPLHLALPHMEAPNHHETIGPGFGAHEEQRNIPIRAEGTDHRSL